MATCKLDGHKNIGRNFDDFLEEQGIKQEIDDIAIKRVVAWQIEQEMKKQGVGKTTLAKGMGTSRSTLNRLLDPKDNSATIKTLHRAARVLGRKLEIRLA